MALSITSWSVLSETPFHKAYNCEDADGNRIVIQGRPHFVSLGTSSYGNMGGCLGPLTGYESLFSVVVEEDGIEELTGWTVIQAALEALDVDFSAVQDDIEAHLASLAYPTGPTLEFTTEGIDDSLLTELET